MSPINQKDVFVCAIGTNFDRFLLIFKALKHKNYLSIFAVTLLYTIIGKIYNDWINYLDFTTSYLK